MESHPQTGRQIGSRGDTPADTPDGRSAALLTAAAMRAAEQAAFAAGCDARALMERAGAEVVAAIFERFPELGGRGPGPERQAAVLCGPGGNGGDGYVIARRLAERGWRVRVLALGRPAEGSDAAAMAAAWAAIGGEVEDLAALDAPALSRAVAAPGALLVDALFGIGLARPLSGALAELGADEGDGPAVPGVRRVAVDVPSGLCADSGRRLGGALPADLTVTFHAAKPGHFLADGPRLCGRLAVRDIGLGPWLAAAGRARREAQAAAAPAGAPGGGAACIRELLEDAAEGPARRARLRDLAAPADDPAQSAARRAELLAALAERTPGALTSIETVGRPDPGWLAKGAGDHKYGHGHLLALSGGVGRGGAARMAARAALRVGAGLVTLGCPPAALIENAARLDAVMLRAVKDVGALGAMLEDLRLNALLLGPGLGAPERVRPLVEAALAAERATVLDADALTAFAGDPAALFARLHPGCVLTPHGGEFARLFPDLAARLSAPAERGPAVSRLDVAREAAARAGAVVLLKGADTVIAAPDGRVRIHAAAYGRAAPWLATAGAGDVLAGLIAGLMARDLAPFDAASTAAWLHVEAARRFGPGLIAEDLPEALPGVLASLLPG